MSTVPYIGSKISLVSNSDIRYEGILYTINTQESTIALQSVRCCGTEGRKVPEIPPSSEIYDFIIFRGQDIKDLTVLESANPALSAQLNDPAIMSVNQRPPGSAVGGKGAGGGKGVSSSGPGYSGGKGVSSSGPGYSGGWGGGWQQKDSHKGGQAYRSGGGGGYGGWGNEGYGGGGGGSGKGSGGKQKGGSDGPKGGCKGGSKGGGKDKGGKGCEKGGGKARPITQTTSNKGSSGKGGGGGQGGGSGGRRSGGGGGAGEGAGGTPVGELLPQVNEAEKSKYTEEFDYEGENKKFDKVLKDVEGDEAVDDKLKPLSGYDKGKSFFDNISCEATERAGDAERPKVDRNKARQNDRETFGDTRRPPRPTGGRRGKGGGRRGGKGYRN